MRQTEISKANALIANKLNLLKSQIGQLNGLSTTAQTDLVAAINEVKAIADSASSGSVSINDNATNNSEVWSSSKINSEIVTAITTALEGEDLSDLAQEIANLQLTDNGLISAVAGQSFSSSQQDQARSNINAVSATDIGNVNFDFEAEITAILTF